MLWRRRSRLFEEIIIRSWWVILFFLVCLFAYDQAGKRRDREECHLQEKRDQLFLSYQEELLLQNDLRREMASQSDHNWIELILMHKLGLVPEGQTKVHFIYKEP